VEALYQDILINVTGFCRDPESFQALRETVYPAVLKGRSPAETIRIWVPGCSTGEEAYSHAISLLEYVTETRADVSVQIFGTDLSATAVRRARVETHKESIHADVSPMVGNTEGLLGSGAELFELVHKKHKI
jgi:two-component system, chemotaxis family, CheB/CheR fusion protein